MLFAGDGKQEFGRIAAQSKLFRACQTTKIKNSAKSSPDSALLRSAVYTSTNPPGVGVFLVWTDKNLTLCV